MDLRYGCAARCRSRTKEKLRHPLDPRPPSPSHVPLFVGMLDLSPLEFGQYLGLSQQGLAADKLGVPGGKGTLKEVGEFIEVSSGSSVSSTTMAPSPFSSRTPHNSCRRWTSLPSPVRSSE